mgnify:CR=1 FL=1
MTDPFEPLRTCLRLEGLDAAALVPGPSFRRLMGRDFHLMERPLVLVIPAGGPPVAVVPSLERASFDGLGFPGAVFDWTDHAGPAAAFAAAATATDNACGSANPTSSAAAITSRRATNRGSSPATSIRAR